MNGCEVSLDTWDLRDGLIDILHLKVAGRQQRKFRVLKHGVEVQCITADLKGPHGWNTGGPRGSIAVLMTKGHRMPQMPQGGPHGQMPSRIRYAIYPTISWLDLSTPELRCNPMAAGKPQYSQDGLFKAKELRA